MTLTGCGAPRVFTPPLRELTPETSLGFAVVEFAEDVVGVTLFPWQRWLFIHALELAEDGDFRFRRVIVLVARQNGKSTVGQILSLFALYVLGVRMVLGTAQDLSTAREVWKGAVELAQGCDELADEIRHVHTGAGFEELALASGERYAIKAANRKAGRGLTSDLVLLDELREHTTWEAWAAITGTLKARPNAQVWCLSNAGDAASIVLRHLRKQAHLLVGDPDGINAADSPTGVVEFADDDAAAEAATGIFEWSARPGRDVFDRQGWAEANPSLGFTITERTMLADARTDPEWVFRTEALCQWSSGSEEGPFPSGAWEAGVDAASQIAPDTPVFVGVDLGWDRKWVWVALAGHRPDGLVHVEVPYRFPTIDAACAALVRLCQRNPQIEAVGLHRAGPIGGAWETFEDAGLPVHAWAGADVPGWCGKFYDLVKPPEGVDDVKCGRLRHLPSEALDTAAAVTVVRPVGGAWAWDRKASPVDAGPLVAATAAVGLLLCPPEKPKTSMYETEGVEVI